MTFRPDTGPGGANPDVCRYNFLHWWWLVPAAEGNFRGTARETALEKLLRTQHSARNFPALCGLCTFTSFLFLKSPSCKKQAITHIWGRENINAWQGDNDPSSKYPLSTHSVCGKNSHTFTVWSSIPSVLCWTCHLLVSVGCLIGFRIAAERSHPRFATHSFIIWIKPPNLCNLPFAVISVSKGP